ncbi:MAG: 5-formyltetrahydrofolate cyclo-ligase [Candidatus Omnitrophota bacterium]|nr:MAG: 5-formyltetrahydrofolate cyclo-ligase [Candidatus Omnitrophota bacterium]
MEEQSLKRKKQEIRERIISKLKRQDEQQRKIKSQKIKEKLFLHPDFKKAQTVMFYIAERFEVDTEDMIKESQRRGKKVVVPITDVNRKELIASLLVDYNKELTKGPFGILEPKSNFVRPVPLKMINLVIVPGIAFDKEDNRLGRGTGYYDRFLSKISKDTCTIALAFDFQIVDSIPTFSHDIKVKEVISA